MNITVVGTGYVGLVTGCCLAEAGHAVVCVDNNADKVASLQHGVTPIYEPGLADMMARNTARGRLTFTTSLADGVAATEAVFLALPTPPQADGSADLSAVLAVAGQLGGCLPDRYVVVIDKSTVPVGTAGLVHAAIADHGGTGFDVVSNPEFLREGYAVRDFMEPGRVVVGTDSDQAAAVMRELYRSFVTDERPLLVMDTATAELTKYAANSFLVTKISFMNEIAQLCERYGADVDQVRQAIGYDSRIGHAFLYPGIGYGGSCFPKDVKALQAMATAQGYDFKLLAAALAVNSQQQRALVDKIMAHYDGLVSGKTFALWGLAFKPNTDDIREAPALVIIDALLARGARIRAYDPEAGGHVQARYADQPAVAIYDEKYVVLDGADALIVATEWAEFVEADMARIVAGLTAAVVFDGRNIFQPAAAATAGLTYYSIGRQSVTPEAAR